MQSVHIDSISPTNAFNMRAQALLEQSMNAHL
jgi:hypothetical protein